MCSSWSYDIILRGEFAAMTLDRTEVVTILNSVLLAESSESSETAEVNPEERSRVSIGRVVGHC